MGNVTSFMATTPSLMGLILTKGRTILDTLARKTSRLVIGAFNDDMKRVE